jgi:hypothetical protein
MSSKSNVVTVFQKMSFSENEVNCSVLTVFHIVKSSAAIIIPLGRHLRFYVINFRKLINVYIFAYLEYRSIS